MNKLYFTIVFFCCLLTSSLPTHAIDYRAPNASITGGRVTSLQSGLQHVDLQQLPAQWQVQPQYIRVFLDSVEIPRLINQSGIVFFIPEKLQVWSDLYGVVLRYTPDQTGLELVTKQVQAITTSQSTYTKTLKYEEQNIYISADPVGEHQDHWWGWYWLRFGTTQPSPISINVPLVDASALFNQPATLKVRLHGGSRGIVHRARIRLNQVELGIVEWQSRTLYEPTLVIPAGLLNSNNTVEIQPLVPDGVAPMSIENAYIDWINIDYQRLMDATSQQIEFQASAGTFAATVPTPQQAYIWDITNPWQPVQLTGWQHTDSLVQWSSNEAFRYTVAGSTRLHAGTFTSWEEPDLRAADFHARYLAVTYNPANSASWSHALQPLLAQREQQGLTTQLVDVQWIYDQFGSGQVDPQALRRFFAHAYATWPIKPEYVLLVGDGTDDPRQFNGPNQYNQTFIPPYLSYVDPWIGETAADNRYVTLVGNDDLPDIHLGRWPVQSPEQVALLVDKTLRFEQTPMDSAWLNRVLFVADDAEPLDAGDFPAISELVRFQLPASVISPTLYFTSGANVTVFRQQLVQELNQGNLFVSYIGHAGIEVWSDESLYQTAEVAQLTNYDRLSIMLPMTCYTGFYQGSFTDSLTEIELLHAGGGSVASWAPTGLGIATGHDYLERGLFDAIYQQGMRRLGPATFYGKQMLAASGVAPDLLNTFTLFGDPALLVPLPIVGITAQADQYSGERDQVLVLDILANDTNPYSTSLSIIAIEQPDHATVRISPDQQTLVFTPDQRFVGSTAFRYTVTNPTNGTQATTSVVVDVINTKQDVYLPRVQR